MHILHGPTSTRWSWAAGAPGCTPAPQTWCSELCTATSPAISRSENHPTNYKQTTVNGKQTTTNNNWIVNIIIMYCIGKSLNMFFASPSPLYIYCVCVGGRGGESKCVYISLTKYSQCVCGCLCVHTFVCMRLYGLVSMQISGLYVFVLLCNAILKQNNHTLSHHPKKCVGTKPSILSWNKWKITVCIKT